MAGRASQRLFIAADPPAGLCAELSAWARQQRGGRSLRLVPPQNVHLTLAFLGEREAGEVDPILGAMALAAQQSPTGAIDGLFTGEPLLLPRRRPRVLAVAIEDPKRELAVLQATLAGTLAEAVGWGETRAYRPHLTLARIGRDGAAPETLSPPTQQEFRIGEILLMRSFLEPSGARYEELARVALI